MNIELKEAFSRIKPVCDIVMVCPSSETIATFSNHVSKLKKGIVQELQQYMLFPFITHIKSKEMETNFELQHKLIDAMRLVLEKVKVNSYEMCMEIETGLLSLVFDGSKTGMVAEVPEELKLSVMRCLTVLMVNLDNRFRVKLLKTQVPLIAQAVFVSVHIAKLDRLRILRLSAIHCVTAHTVTHPKQTDDKYHIPDAGLENLVVDMLSSILPGVLAALQDVATCKDNPGHAIVVASLNAIHRILCITMHDKYLSRKDNLTAEDFANLIRDKTQPKNSEVSNNVPGKNPKDITKRSAEWYIMAGEKLALVTSSVVSLKTHEHYKVRKQLAILCYRIVTECNATMQPSLPDALDVLISLTKDEYAEVSEYCTHAVNTYFASVSHESRLKTMDSVSENFFALLTSLPRILNNIDAGRKLSSLNLMHGYVEMMCSEVRPQPLTLALSSFGNARWLCVALTEAAALQYQGTLLATLADRDPLSPPPTNSPWRRLRHLEPGAGGSEERLRAVCRQLGGAECGDLLLDCLLDMLHQGRDCEIVYVVNCLADSPSAPASLVWRVLDAYLEADVWYLPLEVGGTSDVTSADTLDPTIYNPRAWIKDSVPDLYEGAKEIRYTDISYITPRVLPTRDPNTCATLADAQRNMLLSCLLTEGVGVLSKRIDFRPYLLKTLCLVLERVGSKYEMLHLAGLKAINDITEACCHRSVAELIKCNSDYFTSEVTKMLKKAWNCETGLRILSVVIEYSDASILDCLYGIVEDVLVQSCDKYYEKNLHSYLQVFLTFVECIRKWFPSQVETSVKKSEGNKINLLDDLEVYIKNKEEAERLLSNEEFENETGKSVEEMYKEDLKAKEDNVLDYDDTVTEEKQPPPQHVTMTVSILKRCVNFVGSSRRDESLLALQTLNAGLPALIDHDDIVLPLVHLVWGPLVARFETKDPVIVRRALELLVTVATISKDFIRSRTIREVLPYIYKFLQMSAQESYLKDAGSSYRNSQAFQLQVAAMTALRNLAVDLGLEDERLEEAMTCFDAYLSKKQPKPLQTLAVNFFKTTLEYDYAAVWYHLRKLCNNENVLQPPEGLEPVVGTPYDASDLDYDANIKLTLDISTDDNKI